ncbi:uncharacterized protein LOC130968279 [Arachis stenosperma]|uniref:uncharacterized protein LOC130968279 n=1 Tax=Arachis stenosperma TaxID=217475 RepID=UPI0025ABE8F3|nr:uncharacterized protein LOC130968279 [Arachis stenosperma]
MLLGSSLCSSNAAAQEMSASTTSIHIMALDGIVNVNSLFTLALFVGLTITSPDTALVGGSGGVDTACAAGPSVAEGLISSHVHSFSCFLFSSLIALALKNIINIRKTVEDGDNIDALGGGSNGKVAHFAASFIGEVNAVSLRVGTLVSAFGSVFGCGFLVMALVDLVQIKLGTFGCGSSRYSIAAVAPLLVLVPTALLIYVSLVLYAFTR